MVETYRQRLTIIEDMIKNRSLRNEGKGSIEKDRYTQSLREMVGGTISLVYGQADVSPEERKEIALRGIALLEMLAAKPEEGVQ